MFRGEKKRPKKREGKGELEKIYAVFVGTRDDTNVSRSHSANERVCATGPC